LTRDRAVDGAEGCSLQLLASSAGFLVYAGARDLDTAQRELVEASDFLLKQESVLQTPDSLSGGNYSTFN
jgi:hypothetical protein